MPEHYFFYDSIFSIFFYNFVKTTHIMKTLFIKSIGAIIMALLISTSSLAQETTPKNTITIKGTVTENGEPVIGAYVWAKGTNQGAPTNMNGEYEIVAPKRGKLVFTMVGLKTIKVRIKGRQTINVDMQGVTVSLDDRDLNRTIKKVQKSKK